MSMVGRSCSHVGTYYNPENTTLMRSNSSRGGNFYDGFGYMEHNSLLMMEKRQLFLRSYQFSRKKSLSEKIRLCLTKAKKVLWFRLRSVRKLRRLVWSGLRSAFYSRRATAFLRVINRNQQHLYHTTTSSSSCW